MPEEEYKKYYMRELIHERDCSLSKMKNDDWICGKYNSMCNIDMCDLLKPITDFCVGEEVYMDSSGVKIIKNGLDIKESEFALSKGK